MTTDSKMTETNMRKNWFSFVATTRKKMSRKLKRDVTHREAMKEASTLWPKEKVRLLNKIKREKRKALKNTQSQQASDQKPTPE